jgi:hypothetical protein
MLCTEISVDINRPVDAVFAVLTDIEHRPRLTPTLRQETRTTPGPLRLGSCFTQRLNLFDRIFDATVEVTEYDPPWHFTYHTTLAPFPFAVYCYLTPVGTNTHLSMVIEGTPGAFFGISEIALVLLVNQQLHNDLKHLKEFLEVWQLVSA